MTRFPPIHNTDPACVTAAGVGVGGGGSCCDPGVSCADSSAGCPQAVLAAALPPTGGEPPHSFPWTAITLLAVAGAAAATLTVLTRKVVLSRRRE